MISGQFSHAKSSTWYKSCDFFSWDFDSKKNNISFYIDGDVQEGIKDSGDGKKKFLWTLESNKFNSNVFDYIENNLELVLETYEMIFTYNDKLCDIDNKFKWVPAMGTWIENPKIHEKNKMVSMITSNKTMTEQQKFRVDFANNNKHLMDVFGNGFNPIKNKEKGLNEYKFSVCIENDTFDTYFTEKILDCFATGTIPIYKGTKNITKYFNKEGILFLEDINLESLNEDLYFSKIEAVKDNFQRVLEYNTVEDWIYNKYLKEVV